MTLRDLIRAWLGIELELAEVDGRCDKLEDEIDAIRVELDACTSELSQFKTALRAKAQETRPAVPVYPDYESSQVEALKEFEEKKR